MSRRLRVPRGRGQSRPTRLHDCSAEGQVSRRRRRDGGKEEMTVGFLPLSAEDVDFFGEVWRRHEADPQSSSVESPHALDPTPSKSSCGESSDGLGRGQAAEAVRRRRVQVSRKPQSLPRTQRSADSLPFNMPHSKSSHGPRQSGPCSSSSARRGSAPVLHQNSVETLNTEGVGRPVTCERGSKIKVRFALVANDDGEIVGVRRHEGVWVHSQVGGSDGVDVQLHEHGVGHAVPTAKKLDLVLLAQHSQRHDKPSQ